VVDQVDFIFLVTGHGCVSAPSLLIVHSLFKGDRLVFSTLASLGARLVLPALAGGPLSTVPALLVVAAVLLNE
jgi:hypothetical protein